MALPLGTFVVFLKHSTGTCFITDDQTRHYHLKLTTVIMEWAGLLILAALSPNQRLTGCA